MKQFLCLGNVAVSRSVASRLSTKDERAKVMASIALFQSVGFFVGPGKLLIRFRYISEFNP